MEPLKLIPHFQPQLSVQVRKGFVHEQHRRFRSQGSGNGHTLLLAAGQLRRVAVHEHTDLHDPGYSAHGQVDLLLGELTHLHDGLAALQHLEVIVQSLGLSGGGHLTLQPGDFFRQVLLLFQVIGNKLFRGVHGNGIGVNELDEGLLFVQLAVFVPALVQVFPNILGIFQNFRQTGGVFRLKVDFGHGFLDVGQAERDVLIHGHIGPQSIVLEQEANLALVGGNVDTQLAVEHHLVSNGDAAAGGGFQARDHPQGSGLAAAGGAKERDESVIFDGQIQIVHGVEFAPAFCNMFQLNGGHDVNLLSLCPGLRRWLC